MCICLTAAALAPAATGCGGSAPQRSLVLPADERPVRGGPGHAYRPRAISAAVARRAQIAGLRCARTHGRFFGVHIELYARSLVVSVPAGIGIAPPQRRSGVYVLGGLCSYPVRTFEPTGVIVLDSGRTLTLGALFAVWGQPLTRHALAGFGGRVAAFVDGRRWPAWPSTIPLRRHAEIVLEVDGEIPPHPRYTFAPGL